MALSDIIKIGASIFGGGGNPIASLATNFLLSKALGADTKDAIKYAGLGSLLSGGLGTPGIFGEKAEQMSALQNAAANKQAENAISQAVQQQTSPANIAKQGIASLEPAKGTLGIASGLAKAGMIDPQGGLASLLNSQMGEAGAFALASLLADKFSSDDEDQVRRPFGGVEGSVDINIPKRLVAGGTVDGQYFPRRNGGIMPSEGSGQKDDVPAMLMAGEFVLKKDAVKGLGGGDLNKGIERAYAMQNKLASQGA